MQLNTSKPTSPLLQLKEPAHGGHAAPSLRAFLEMGFRPLYLGGMVWALVAIGVWVYAPQALTGPLQGLAWHAHEMLWGFIATIAVGFLMTAGGNWTGINPLQGPALAAVCVLWLVARIGFLVNNLAVYWLAAACELGFFLVAAMALMRSVYQAKNARNYAVPWLLVGLALGDALYLHSARGGDIAQLMQVFNAALVVMALIALLIGRRVIPFFAMRAVPGLALPLHTGTGQVQWAACAVAALSTLAGLPLLTAAALGLAGVLALVQVLGWKPLAVRGRPLLWILYAGYAGVGLGLLAAGLATGGVGLPRALPVHVIAMAGFSVLIIGMVTRTALGHLGRALAADRLVQACYGLLLLAVVLRLAAIFHTAWALEWLQFSACAWMLAIALYLWRFVPMLIRPRL